MEYFYDETSRLSIEDIAQKEFSQKIPSTFSFGYINGTSWYKFTLQNQSDSDHYIISFLEAFSDNLNLYREKNGLYTKSKGGLLVPLNERELHDAHPSFILDLKKGEEKTYFIEASSRFSSAGEFVIYEEYTYLTSKSMYLGMYMFYFGSLFVVTLFSLFLYTSTKDKLYGYYTAYIFSYAMFILMLSGIDLYFGFEHLHDEFHIATPLVMVFLTLFSIYFLQVKVFYPKLYKALIANVVAYVILVPLVFLSVEPWIEVANFITTFTFIILIITAALTTKKGYKLAKYYLVIMLIYIVSLFLMSSSLLGDVEYTRFNRHIFILVSYFEITFFSLLLTQIYNKSIPKSARDPLTGLYDRRHFSNIAQKSLSMSKENNQAFSILMIDIDSFKELNDIYGEQTGDNILVQMSHKLVELSRDQDIVSRHGGQEFIMLLPNTDTNEAKIIANEIREKISDIDFITHMHEEINITVSIGVSQSSFDDNLTIEKIILDADINLYQAKESGRNKVYSV